ncbi:kinase [Peribacillus sp. SCS-155]|uniref:kinase n=1 Tax=Peribacillus sedimenti TaxID=3115297 RepID=UPI003905FCF6
MKELESIIISGTKGKQVEVVDNPSPYELIGKGLQGAVFQLSEDKCAKKFARDEDALKEAKSLSILQDSRIGPRVFEFGKDYIIMEYFNGPNLEDYLKSKGCITKHITKQIIFVLNELERLGFTRVDAQLRHIMLTEDEELKVIDHVNSRTKIRKKPNAIFKGLKKLGLLSAFLRKVKKIDSSLYEQWTKSTKTDYPFE